MSWLFTLFIYTHAAFCIGPPCLQSRLCVKSNRTPPNTPPALLSSDWLPRQNKQQPANLEFCPPAPTHLPWNKPLLRARQQPFFCCLLDLFIYVVGRLLGFLGFFFKTPKTPWSYDVHYSGIRPAGGGNTWHEPKQTNWARVSPKNDPRSPALTVRGECGEQAGIIVVCVLVWRATRWISSE